MRACDCRFAHRLFYPNPKPSTSAGFASSSTKKSSKLSSNTLSTSSQSSSSSSRASASINGTPTQWTDLSLNQQIGILIQEIISAQGTVDAEDFIIQMSHYAMSGRLENGTILGISVDNLGQVNKLGNDLKITLDNSGMVMTDTLEKAISTYYHDSSSKTLTNNLAQKIISPTALQDYTNSQSNHESSLSLINSQIIGTYSFINPKSGDNQQSLTLSQGGSVTQKQNSSDGRTFTGSYSISLQNSIKQSYKSFNTQDYTLVNVNTVAKISVIWDNGCGNQDYYVYFSNDAYGHATTVLTDGVQ